MAEMSIAHEKLEKDAVKKSFPSKFKQFSKEESKEKNIDKAPKKKVRK